MSDNVYQAPTSDLKENTVPFGGSASLENGIAGNYEFSIGAILSEAWEKTKGAKGTLWLAVLLYMAALIGIAIVAAILAGVTGSHGKMGLVPLLMQIVQFLVTAPLMAGFAMIGIKLAVRAPVQSTEVFNYFSKMLPLAGGLLLLYLMVVIGFVLLILPGIYLALAYMLAIPLMVEKNLGPWEALEASRKAITHHWFGVFFLYLIMGLIAAISAIPLGVGLIWTLPMAMLVNGVLYRTIFGYEGNVQSE